MYFEKSFLPLADYNGKLRVTTAIPYGARPNTAAQARGHGLAAG